MQTVLETGGSGTTRLRLSKYVGPWQIELAFDAASRHFTVPHGAEIVIGSGDGADVRVHDAAVSQRHVALNATDEGLVVRDLDSTNGTYVGAARVRRAVLSGGSTTMVIGNTTVLAEFAERAAEDPGEHSVPGLVGRSLLMRRLAADVVRYAPLGAPVLILGETGSGKEVVARALHALSGRRGAFVPLNVGALHESLADAELFGHSRGAFTGAVAARVGAFQEAGDGTLFLDEIADLAPSVQVKLLRVLEERTLRPLGGGPVVPVRARIVSACWAPVDDFTAVRAFRVDLYHRISTIVLRVPPLRARKTDIGLLSRALLERHAPELGRKELSPRALARLLDYDWPGNVRQLGAVLYRAAIQSPRNVIEWRQVDAALPESCARRVQSMDRAEAAAFLGLHGQNVTRAAKAAGVSRSTFRAWLGKRRGDGNG